jgi:hypothetical protein
MGLPLKCIPSGYRKVSLVDEALLAGSWCVTFPILHFLSSLGQPVRGSGSANSGEGHDKRYSGVVSTGTKISKVKISMCYCASTITV